MPKSSLDWLGIASLWIGALILAIKTGDVPLIEGAPGFLASSAWGYVPFALVSMSGALFLYRALAPSRAPAATAPSDAEQMPAVILLEKEPKEPRLTLHMEHPDISVTQALKIVAESAWAKERQASREDCLREMRDKLAAHRLTAFGRREAEAVIEPIPWKMWPAMRLDADDKAAIMQETVEGVFSDLQFDKSYVKSIWPLPRGPNSWMA